VGRVIIVDDEAELMTVLCEILTGHGYETVGCTSAAEALAKLKKQDFDLLLTDLMMPEMGGIELFQAALEIDPDIVGIVMTGQGTVQTAVEAMKTGAFDYIMKPFTLNSLLPVLSHAMEVRHLRADNMQLRETVAMHELGQALAFSSDLNQILNKVTDAVLQQCDADEASIMLPTSDGKELIIAVARGGHAEQIGKRIPMGQGIAGWVAQNLKPVTLNGEVHDERFTPINPRADIRAAVSIPLLVGGNLVGVLNVNITRPHRRFTLGQVKTLNMLVNIVSPILENARLYVEKKRAEERYRSIFENAQEGIFQTTYEGQYLAANRALATVLGYDSPEDLMTTVIDIPTQLYVNPEDRKVLLKMMKEQVPVKGFETQFYRKDGSIIWVSVNQHAVHDAEGRVSYYEGFNEDITIKKESVERMKKALWATVQAIAVTVERRDPYTAGHQRRVADLASAIATEMNLPTDQIDGIRMVAIIHDLGKISVPAEILSKPSELTDLEFGIIKTHAQSGHDILKDIEFPWPIARMVLEHHERMDGSGYPNGLVAEETLLESRILSVADVVESMASHRPYRPALGIDAALEEIENKRGTHYDTSTVDACLRIFRENGYQLIKGT
jgi:PAS domain S-box-containing protein